ncbi:unnamed protein product [Microthlaspi erraticum]|uniref:MATH domain-containing protein n=1 Tax=Microthlaspi erraticum TaxID=1685480 RepID=A0A6D2IW17_9BRAS|nr:unnamed protein product [Microthlaspi erraticum]
MEDHKQTSFTFEIDNFSDKETVLQSPKFLSGGCLWYVELFPKGYNVDDHLSIYLCVANPESLRLGWKRRATFSFVLLNKSGKELHKTAGFLEKNKLLVKVEVKVVEVVDEGVVTGNETLNVYGFRVLYSQAMEVSRLFLEHPDIAVSFRPKNKLVKTTYMNLLLGLIESLNKPPHSITQTELRNAQSELMDLTEAGFSLDWLKTKLDEVSLERKKANADCFRVRELEEHIKNLEPELNREKMKSSTYATQVVSLEHTLRTISQISELSRTRTLANSPGNLGIF